VTVLLVALVHVFFTFVLVAHWWLSFSFIVAFLLVTLFPTWYAMAGDFQQIFYIKKINKKSQKFKQWDFVFSIFLRGRTTTKSKTSKEVKKIISGLNLFFYLF
jgi:hypothetical protein